MHILIFLILFASGNTHPGIYTEFGKDVRSELMIRLGQSPDTEVYEGGKNH